MGPALELAVSGSFRDPPRGVVWAGNVVSARLAERERRNDEEPDQRQYPDGRHGPARAAPTELGAPI